MRLLCASTSQTLNGRVDASGRGISEAQYCAFLLKGGNMYIKMFAGALSALVLAGTAQAQATFGTEQAVEDPATGFVGTIPTSVTPVIVASDGESAFHPFQLGFDVSDAISLSANWAPDPAYAAAFGADGWQQAPGTFVWYLPACIPGAVCENGDVFEPIGKWDFTPGTGWSADAQNILLTDSDGSFSDFIGIANDGVNGTGATVTFQSGGAVPEPATWAMMLLGFGAIGFTMRRRNAAIAQLA